MKRIAAIVLFVSIMTPGNTLLAASLYNNDTKEYKIQIRSSGDPWVYMTLSQGSYTYFDCTYGCQIKIIETDSTMKLKSDADVVIDEGRLKTR